MKLREELAVSDLGLGCMGMTGFYGKVDQKQCIQAIHTAIENGITFLDTADNYGFGANETLVGTAIATYRNRVSIIPLFGTTQSIHILENIKSASVNLMQHEIAKINEIVSRGVVRGDRHTEVAKKLYDQL